MTLQRIAFLLPPKGSQYGVLEHFSLHLAQALEQLGCQTEQLTPSLLGTQGLTTHLIASQPDLTICFNGPLPDEKTGLSLASSLNLPHLGYLVDSPHMFLPMFSCPQTLISCHDEANVHFAQAFGAKKSFFLPHGVEEEGMSSPHNEREIDLLFLGTLKTPEYIENSWKKHLPPELGELVKATAETLLQNHQVPLAQGVTQAMAASPEHKEYSLQMIEFVELYVRAKERYQLLQDLAPLPIHLYSATPPDVDKKSYWTSIQKELPHLRIHGPATFSQAMELMEKSQILLSSSPHSRFGSHERVFTGLAKGALVLPFRGPWLEREFREGEEIAFCDYGKKEATQQSVRRYLEDPQKRREVVLQGQQVVRSRHTWKQRAQEILEHVPKLL